MTVGSSFWTPIILKFFLGLNNPSDLDCVNFGDYSWLFYLILWLLTLDCYQNPFYIVGFLLGVESLLTLNALDFSDEYFWVCIIVMIDLELLKVWLGDNNVAESTEVV